MRILTAIAVLAVAAYIVVPLFSVDTGAERGVRVATIEAAVTGQ